MLVDPWLTGELTFAGQNWAFEARPSMLLIAAALCLKLHCAKHLYFLATFVSVQSCSHLSTASEWSQLDADGWLHMQGRKGLDPPLDIDAIAAKADLMLLSQVLPSSRPG